LPEHETEFEHAENEIGMGVEVALDVADGIAEATVREIARGVVERAGGEIAGERECGFVPARLEKAEGRDGDRGVVLLDRGMEPELVEVPAARLVIALWVVDAVVVLEGDASEPVDQALAVALVALVAGGEISGRQPEQGPALGPADLGEGAGHGRV